MKKIWLFLIDLPRQWRAETPKIAKDIRNISGSLFVAIPGVWAVIQNMPNIIIPAWVNDCILYATIISGLITLIAGTKEKK